MSSRFAATALPLRTITRSAGIAGPRCSRLQPVKHVHRSSTKFATLDNSIMEPPAQVLSPPNISLARSLSREKKVSTLPPSPPWPVDGSVRVSEKDKKLVFGEKHGKIARAWEPAEKQLWLERFGGPGKTRERVIGKGTVVLRDVTPDGKGYLRVLI